MKIFFDKSFSKSLDKIKDQKTKLALLKFIENLKAANNLQEIKQIKKIKGFKSYYRYRLGDYRIGFELTDENNILLIIVAKRNDIYKKFP